MALSIVLLTSSLNLHVPVMAETVSENMKAQIDEVLPDLMESKINTVNDAESLKTSSGFGTDGKFKYEYYSDDTAKITGYEGEEEGSLNIPSYINGYKVTTIGDNAFHGCSGFTGNLTIPDSVTTIGSSAFAGCGFTGDLTIPNSVTTIGDNAFSFCSGFTGNLTISNSVEIIGDYTFYDCTGFTGNLTIPDSVTTIGNCAFRGCDGFTGNLTISNNVITIGNLAFYDCTGFVGDLIIPNSVTEIGDAAFSHCTGFEGDLIIPNNVTAIGESAFSYCSGFTGKLTISNSVTTIGYCAFLGCTGIKRVENNTDIFLGLPDLDNCKWKNEATGNEITFIANGVAIKDSSDNIKEISCNSMINGRGYANYELTLTNDNGEALQNKWISYQFKDQNGKNEGNKIVDKTNNEGKVLIESPTYENTNVLGTSTSFPLTAVVLSGDEETEYAKINFNVTVNPLSFSQAWSLRDEGSLAANIGPGAGVEVGPVEAEANVAKAEVRGGVGSTLSAEHEYINGKRNLSLNNQFDSKVGIYGELGPKANADLIAGAEISAFHVEGEATKGESIMAGKIIEDYNPNDTEDLKDIGLFMMGTTACATGNLFIVALCNMLGEDCYNIYGSEKTVDVNANANVLNIAINAVDDTDTEIASGTIGRVDFDSQYNYGVKKENNKEGSIYTMEKNSAVTGTVVQANFEPIGFSWSPEGWSGDIGLNGNVCPQRYKLEASPEDFSVEQQVSKNDISFTWFSGARETKEKFYYDQDKLSSLYASVPAFDKFAHGRSYFILDSAFQDINDKLKTSTAEAEYARKIHDKTVFSTGDLDIAVNLGVGVKAGMNLSGITEFEYEAQSGTFKDGKTNVTAVNDIEKLVQNNKIDFVTLIKEALSSAANKAKDFIIGVSDKVGEVVNGACTAVWSAGENLYDRFLNVVKVKSDNSSETSYVITTYGNGGSGDISLASVGDEMTGEAVTVGEPYYVFVTESDGTTVVESFQDSPVDVSIAYTDDMLYKIGATTDDEDDIEMFKYDEDKCGYVSVGGDVDKENNKVAVTITEGGQFILAINREISHNGNEPGEDDNNTVSDNKAVASENVLDKISSKTFTVGSDTYTVSWNTYVRFDGRKHNGVGTDASGKAVGVKESKSKVCDLKLAITKNGELVDPAKYTVNAKNNKNASVSIDGMTEIGSNSKKPFYKIKFKGKEFKELNKAVKSTTFEFGIVPAELKQEAVTFDKVKTGKDGIKQIKKITFKPESAEGGIAPKALNLKFNKQENKTDYVTETGADGSIKVIGKNNFYGSVIYK